MYIGAVTLFAVDRSRVLLEIFSSAEANPSGYRVRRTAEASARYSRFLDMAKYNSRAKIGARMANTMDTINIMAWACPPSLDEDLDRNRLEEPEE